MASDIGLHGGIDAIQTRHFDSDKTGNPEFTAAAIFAGGSKVTLFLEPRDPQAVAMLRQLADEIESGTRSEAAGSYRYPEWVR